MPVLFLTDISSPRCTVARLRAGDKPVMIYSTANSRGWGAWAADAGTATTRSSRGGGGLLRPGGGDGETLATLSRTTPTTPLHLILPSRTRRRTFSVCLHMHAAKTCPVVVCTAVPLEAFAADAFIRAIIRARSARIQSQMGFMTADTLVHLLELQPATCMAGRARYCAHQDGGVVLVWRKWRTTTT